MFEIKEVEKVHVTGGFFYLPVSLAVLLILLT
jgi:hypothetical protein